ncbi:hypothetical protein [Leeuwenhoekiella marinoflava]|uniref:Transposase n=2 Tax=Leeuwenhoekiella marinoflava TaxID=988 RepID=A0A4Q0PKY2_9FLAO|nr:hypothetical protein [Leeuwenhoekiella marinoflava]RXG29145.1 hypothetical protein DSL99_2083 [Leeuwenhoekiella marinoflava]SHF33158.1 hypothetical protein SAMN02745246_02220 [Leeuwenhoekiella marinoflava DSM 3653]
MLLKYPFWQHPNKRIELWSRIVLKQKLEYIHNNPVKSGFVTNPIAWKYYSARNFQDDPTVIKTDTMGFMG